MKKRVPAMKASAGEGGFFPPLKRKKSPADPAASRNGSHQAAPDFSIDYPRPFEKVKRGHYAIRIHAPSASRVQVALDGRSWQDCRSAVGFFWYDWHPSENGKRLIAARAPGAWGAVEERVCEVVP